MTILHEAKQFIFRVIVLCIAMFKTFARDRCVLALSLVLSLSTWTTVFAAPMGGREVTLQQPDGTLIRVKAFGDEFFNWLETDNGYVVIQAPHTKEYTYASLSANRNEYESTGIPVGKDWGKLTQKEQKRIQNLEKKIRISKKSRREKIDLVRKVLSRDEEGRIVMPENQTDFSIQHAPTADGSPVAAAETTAAAGAAAAISNNRRGLALMVRFPDYLADETVSQAQVESHFNDIPYTTGGSATSVRGYFKIQSHDQLDIQHTVTPYFTAPNNRSYYEASATQYLRIQELFIFRLEQLKAQGFDFTQLDANGDGEVDCVTMLYAGGWLAAFNGWSGGMTWSGFADYGLATSFPMVLAPQAANPELFILCHELGHAICKFPDLYPYDGNAAHAGSFCLMSGGGGRHPDSVSGAMKYQAGWVTAMDVTTSGLTSHSLAAGGPNVIRYVNPNNPKEYFLFEMRGEVGYEGPYGGSSVEICPSKGLVAYHVREDGNNANCSIFTAHNPNCDYSKPPRVMVVEDNPQSIVTPWYDDMIPDEEDAFDTGDKVNSSTTPNFNFWSSNGRTIDSGIGIENIQVGTSTLTFSMYNRNPTAITASPRVVVANGTSALSVAATGMVSYSWSIVSGPGAVTFGTPNNRQTTVTFGSAIGNYLLRLTMSDGVKNFVSEIAIQVTAGVSEYLGYYKLFPVVDPNWDTGWIELVGNQLQWRNPSGWDWNLFETAEKDLFVTDGTCPYGAGRYFRFQRQNGYITGFDYLLSGRIYTPSAPVPNNFTVSTTKNTAVGVTLTAKDFESQAVGYSVFTNPAHGTLSGTAPNLTYTPHNNYVGGDCFTYKATDGTYDSNVATVTIRINSVPVVDAGSNQTVTLAVDASVRNPVAGAYFEWNAAQDVDADNTWESTTAQTYNWTMAAGAQAPAAVTDSRFNVTKAYLFPAAKSIAQATFQNSVNENASATWEFLLDADSNDGLIMESGGGTDGIQFWIAGGVLKGLVRDSGKIATVSYTLKAGDMAGFIHVVYTINMLTNDFSLYVNGIAVNSVTWTGADWSDGNNAALGCVAGTAPGGSVVDFSGKMALVRFYDGRALTPDEVIINCASLLRKVATVSLPANASDLDGDALTTTWSLVSTNPTGMNVSFGNNFALGSTATVVQSGIYVLRLTVSDGLVTVFDEVTITVSPVPLQNYTAWVNAGGFAHVLTDINPTANPDGDLMSNLMEFALGTDPTLQDSKSLAIDGSVNGLPLPVKAGGGVFEYYFVRRKDHGAAGSVSYTVQFSDDLSGFTNSAVSPSFVANSSANGDYELVKVPYPSGFRFGRLQIEPVP